jgi:hypothetical protein
MAAILQKFFIYDPAVYAGDELGGLRVMPGDDGLHVMAQPLSVQYWVDTGMAGREPLSKLSEAGKKLLAQNTRGRSESDDEPTRVPRYSRATQSGAPGFAGHVSQLSGSARQKKRSKDAATKTKEAGRKPPQRREPRQPSTPVE